MMAFKMMSLLFIGLLAHMVCGQDVHKMYEEMADLKFQVATMLDKETFLSAFSYTNKGVMTLSPGRNLVMPNEILKIGNDYNPSTGVYTAPRTGLYLFNLHIGTNQRVTGFVMQLLANNQVVSRLWVIDTDNDAQSAISNVVHLEKGQTVSVYIERTYGQREMDDRFYSVFSGVLLQQS